MVVQLHLLLAEAGLALAVLLFVEAAWRAWRRVAPGRLSSSLETIAVIALLVAAAGGLGLLAGGSGLHDSLHLLYGVLALGALPVGNALAKGASLRRAALVSLLTRIVMVVLIARLFQTG